MTEDIPRLPPEMVEAGAAVIRDGEVLDWHRANDVASRVYLAMFQVLIDEGYMLVRVDPTGAMVAAASVLKRPDPYSVWRAMCEASE